MATVHFDQIGKFLYTKDDIGNYHSYNDNPAIEYLDGSCKIWYKNGLIHRIDNPAIIYYYVSPELISLGNYLDYWANGFYFKMLRCDFYENGIFIPPL
jgi:hypothetical protein